MKVRNTILHSIGKPDFLPVALRGRWVSLENNMQLQTITTPAKAAVPERIAYEGQAGDIEVAHGQAFKSEVAPGGSEVLNAGPLAGKRWVVYTKVSIQEFDV